MRPVDVKFDKAEFYDVLLTTCGYERRSSYLCRLGVDARLKFAATYPGGLDKQFDQNVAYYAEREWSIDSAEVGIDAAFVAAQISGGTFAIDISSMPRRALASVVERVATMDLSGVTIRLLYCPGDFENSVKAAKRPENLTATPVSLFFAGALRPPSVPIGLVVGLGLEEHRAVGLMELLEPARTWAFTSSTADVRYQEATKAVNESLLLTFQEGNLFEYDLASLEAIFASLESLVFSVERDYRLILAPSGPKIFSLGCLLVASKRDASRPAVWRVGGSEPSPVANVEENGHVFAAELR